MVNRPFLTTISPRTTTSPEARCMVSAREIVLLTHALQSATSLGLLGTLNCHQHGLILAAGIFIFEIRRAESASACQVALSNLLQIFTFLDELSQYRPAARLALTNLQSLALSHRVPTFTSASERLENPVPDSSDDNRDYLLSFERYPWNIGDADAAHTLTGTENSVFDTLFNDITTNTNHWLSGMYSENLGAANDLGTEQGSGPIGIDALANPDASLSFLLSMMES